MQKLVPAHPSWTARLNALWHSARGVRRWQRAEFALLVYAGLLLVTVLCFHYAAHWWPVALALYLPRILLLVPALALLFWLRHNLRGLLLLAGCVCLVLGPLMGLRAFAPSPPAAASVSIKVLTHNAHSLSDPQALVAGLSAANCDVILLQEAAGKSTAWWSAQLPSHHWFTFAEFVFGSRYPIKKVHFAEPPNTPRRATSPRFIGFTLEVQGQLLRVYNVHPPSLRRAVGNALKGLGNPSQLGAAKQALQRNFALRAATLQAVLDEARASNLPVVIAGDTNVPDELGARVALFDGFVDAFHAAGSGFGYTFPAEPAPWLRLDRILGHGALSFSAAQTWASPTSDHLGVVAELQL